MSGAPREGAPVAVGTLDAYLAVMDADRCATLTSEAPYG